MPFRVLAVVILGLLSAACSQDGDHAAPIDPTGGPAPTGLLVITLDTTRADRIGSYGFRQAGTPNIDRLAEHGVLFEEAVTPTPLTLPAHASLFTGYQPPHHGVRGNGGLLADEPNVTLAEVLRDQGFRTGAFIGSAVLRRWAGLSQGFATYGDDFPLETTAFDTSYAERRAEDVISAATDWLSGIGEAPYFLWVHLFDPHGPFDPPEKFAQEFAETLYQGEIAYSDEQIGVLLAALDRLGLRDRTLVAFLSDHGEGLSEHDEVSHGYFLYDSTLRIPFVLSCPTVLPQRLRVNSLVEIVDFVPTALEILGAANGTRTGGRNLLPLIRGEGIDEASAYAETYYPLETQGWSPIYALRRDGFKVIKAPTPELYDLRRDPAERSNIFVERRELGEELLATLETLGRKISRDLPDRDAPIDAARRRALESLGYVVGADTPAGPTGPLKDPKDGLATLEIMDEARRLLAQHKQRETLLLLVDLARREPRSPAVVELLASTLLASGQFESARTAYARLLELAPRHDRGLFNMGILEAKAGNTDTGLAYLERAHAVHPDDPLVLLNLGLLWFEGREDPQAGRPYLERFLELEPDDPDAAMVRGLLAGGQNP